MVEGGAALHGGVTIVDAAVAHRSVQRVRGRAGHGDGAPRGPAGHPPPRPVWPILERSTYLVLAMPGVVVASHCATSPSGTRTGSSTEAPLLVVGLRDHVFPAGPGRGPGIAGPRPGQPRRGGPIPRDSAGCRAPAGHVAARRARPGRRVLPGIPVRGDRAHRHPGPDPHRRQTLATQFWAYQQNLSYGQAAPFALVMIAVAAVPSYVLGRFFDRLPARSSS